jgi:alkylation response protein AidB-like acyl-CoA dehydrogenase
VDFEHNEEQRAIAQSLRKFLAGHYGFDDRRRAADGGARIGAAAWSAMAAMGVLGLPFAPEVGGFGGGAVDLMAPMEAMGEFLLTEPVLDQVALAGRLVARSGSVAQRQAWLPSLIDGSQRACFAYLEPDRRFALAPVATTARRTAQGWMLQGRKLMVDGAPGADWLVVSASTGGGASLFLVKRAQPGLRVSSYRTLDGRQVGDVWLEQAQLPADALLGAEEGAALPQIEEAVDFACALLCSDAVGAMADANAATLDYLKSRQQFGVPLGSFQALQHRMVDMFMACEQARSMAILAACRVDAPAGDEPGAAARKAAVSAAMVCILEAARRISQESVQLHGAMGMTDDTKISHTFRRLTALGHRFGDVDHHMERYASCS